MYTDYEVQRISKKRVDTLRKSGGLAGAILLDSFDGFLVVQPAGSNLGDGEILAPETADYELSSVWCTGSKTKLREARQRLGLEVNEPQGAMAIA